MNPLVKTILSLHDRGAKVAAIAAAEGVTQGHVYAILREHRPDRPREARTRTGAKRRLVLGLLAKGYQPPRVAFLARCSAAYVYRLAEELAA